MSKINGVIVAGLAALCLAAGPTDSFDRWLSDTVKEVVYYVPTQHVYVLVEKVNWDTRIVKAANTAEQDRAIRRSVCFGLYDHNAARWEWEPAKSSYEIYALSGATKTVLASGDVLNCTVEEAKAIWLKQAPSHSAKRHI